MSQAAVELSASIELARASFSHNLTKGEAIEAALRSFLRKHLPDSIGVARGQVVDRHGQMSTQLDAILYDSRRTPILFSDAGGESRLIPVEGVIAAIECKTSIKLGDIPGLAQSAAILKTMDRTAYYPYESTVLRHFVRAYGREWSVLPVLYFVFAFDGPNVNSIGSAMNDAHGSRELHERIDMVCVMNRGVVVNGQISQEADGSVKVRNIDSIATPGSVLVPYHTEHALLMFYMLLCKYALQGEVPPIAIQQYIPPDFVY